MKSTWIKTLVSLTLVVGLLLLSTIPLAIAENISTPSDIKTPITADMFSLNISNATYDGNPHGATVSSSTATFSSSITYNGSTTAPINAGTYTVAATVTGNGNYEGSLTLNGTLTISAIPITADMFTLNISNATYDGNPHGATVSSSTATFNSSITYNGSTTAPINADSYTVTATVTGTDNYQGSLTLPSGTLTISAAPITSISLTPIQFSFIDGKIQKPTVTVTSGGKTLVENTDYSVTAPDSIVPGTYTITVNGTGNYTGQKTADYEIVASSDFTISLSQTEFTFVDSTIQKPTVTVTSGGNQLVENTDYTVTFPDDCINVDTYTVTVNGKGNYTGTKSADYKINASSDFTVSLSQTEFTFVDSTVQKPTVTVTSGGKTLVENTDYTVTFPDDCINVDTYTVTVNGKGNYTGTKSADYKINASSDFTVNWGDDEFYYNQKVQQPIVKVTSGNTELVKGTDYDISIPVSINASDSPYTVSIKAKGNYTGEDSSTYTIKPATGDIVVILDNSTFTYTGELQQPSIESVKCGEMELSTTDYSVEMPNSINANKANEKYTVTVTTSENIEKDGSATYVINQRSLADENVIKSLGYTEREYDATEGYPAETVTYNGMTPTFDVTRNTGKDVGDYSVTLTGTGNYTGEVTLPYAIKPNTSPIVVTLSQNAFTYTSKAQYPTVDKVTCGSLVLTEENGDYTVTLPAESIYVNNKYTVDVITSMNFKNNGSNNYSINWLPTPSNPVNLVGTYNTQTGWYYNTPVQITPASGYTIGYGIMSSELGNAYLARQDGVHSNVTVHLMNKKGEITDAIIAPAYKQDTVAPKFTVSMGSYSPYVNAKASDLNGTFIDFYSGTHLVDSVSFQPASPNLEVEMRRTLTSPSTYSIMIRDNAGNTSFSPDEFKFYFVDTDRDGLIDVFEKSWGSDPALEDTDSDGLNDYEEHRYRTSPTSADTDTDKVSDADEVLLYSTDPNKPDSDDDGIDDYSSIMAASFFANSKNATTALNLLLANKTTKVAPALPDGSVVNALATLADNGYLSTLPVVPFEQAARTRLSRDSESVNLRKGAEIIMVKADPVNSRLWGIHEPSGLLVEFSVTQRGRLDAVKAIDLCELFGVDALSGLSVMSDDNATVFVIGNWDSSANKTLSDLVIVAPNELAAWKIDNSINCTRFEVSADGSKIAYSNGSTLTVLDMISGNPLGDLTADGSLLGFTSEGKVISSLNNGEATVYSLDSDASTLVAASESFYGICYTKQPTIKDVIAQLTVKAGNHPLAAEDTTITLDPNGFATARINLTTLAYQVEGKRNSIAYTKFLQAE